jgi:hypothetical protein
VRVAVVLACIAGCDVVTVTSESPYPIVQGPTCQLRFRNHPDLGTVAQFDLFDKTRHYSSDPSELEAVMHENSLGAVHYGENWSSFYPDQDIRVLWGDVEQDIITRRNNCIHPTCHALTEKKSLEDLYKTS